MNDSPADCQNREWTEPQRDLGPAVCEVFIAEGVIPPPYKFYTK